MHPTIPSLKATLQSVRRELSLLFCLFVHHVCTETYRIAPLVATPGDQFDGGTGSGCAQHLACLLDSPFALAILIVFGVSVEARHTAFRRLAIHEAAAADSPQCLSLLMELGARFSTELFRDAIAPSSSLAATAASACGDGMKWRLSSQSSTAASANTTELSDSFGGSISQSFSSESAEEERTKNYKKTGKKKLNIFSG